VGGGWVKNNKRSSIQNQLIFLRLFRTNNFKPQFTHNTSIFFQIVNWCTALREP